MGSGEIIQSYEKSNRQCALVSASRARQSMNEIEKPSANLPPQGSGCQSQARGAAETFPTCLPPKKPSFLTGPPTSQETEQRWVCYFKAEHLP